MGQQQIYVNRTGRVTDGIHDGTIGHVIGADWIEKLVQLRDSEGRTITVPWDFVEQFED